MNKTKPKGKTPSLIGASNGKPKRINVVRKSKCVRCGDDIEVGQDCFGIPKVGSGFSSIRRYCHGCYHSVLEQTCKDLEEAKKI